MVCPRAKCGSERLHVTHHYNCNHERLPRDLRGLNVTRRRLQCLECGFRFWSIELPEEEYDELKRPPSRLAQQHAKLRT